MAFNQIQLDAGLSVPKYGGFVVGRVRSVVLSPYLDDGKTVNPEYTTPSDIGKIRYDILYQNRKALLGETTSRPAWPIFSFVKQYPVIGELVLLIMGPTQELNDYASAQQAYYFPPYNVWNSINHNAFPDLSEYADFLKKYYEKPEYQYNQTGSMPELPKGVYFSEKPIKKLVPFEGDTIIEGRFGQSIRFGSTSKIKSKENPWSSYGEDGSPITIIRNGEGKDTRIVEITSDTAIAYSLPDQPTVENINYDHSSIYLTSNQIVNIESLLEIFPMKSYNIAQRTQTQTRVQAIQQNPTINESKSARENDKA
jgi:hypothetical protein